MKKFEEYLKAMEGKIRKIKSFERFDRMGEISTYYHNNANELYIATITLWQAAKDKNNDNNFPLAAVLTRPTQLLAGLSIELILKAIAKILERPLIESHNLIKLCDNVGITLNDDHMAILKALTELISWQGKYPTPKTRKQFENTIDAFSDLKNTKKITDTLVVNTHNEDRSISLENFLSIWVILSEKYWDAKNKIIEP